MNYVYRKAAWNLTLLAASVAGVTAYVLAMGGLLWVIIELFQTYTG